MIGIIATYKATFLHCLRCAFCLPVTFLIMTSYFSEGSGRSFQTGNAAINSLQEWCRRRTKYHEVSQYYVHHAVTSAALIILKNVQDLHIHLVITIIYISDIWYPPFLPRLFSLFQYVICRQILPVCCRLIRSAITATNILSLVTKNSVVVATLETRFLYDLDLN